MQTRLVVLLVLATLLTACASANKKRPKQIFNESFLTDIKEDGTKLFIYVANFFGDPGRGSRRTGRLSSIADVQEEITLEGLELKLRTTRYCRHGYLLLSNYNQFGSVEIRGECQEGATESDRKLFM